MIRVSYDLAMPVTDPAREAEHKRLPVEDLHERDTSYWSTILTNQAGSAEAPAKGRESAAKWQPVLTAIVALVGASTIIAGRDTLAKMNSLHAWVIVGGLSVVLLCAAIGAWTAQKAATGSIGLEQGDKDAGIGAYRSSTAHETFKLRRRLRTAGVLTAAAFGLGLAVLVFWLMAPAAPSIPSSPKVAITFEDGTSFSCASLLPTDKDTLITFQPANGAKMTLNASQVKKIEAVSC